MDLKTHIKEKIEGWTKSYSNDLKAMSEESLAKAPGGSARTAFDFTYEVVYVNNRVATWLRGEDPGPWPDDGWMTAPPEFCTKEAALSQFEESTKAVLDGWEATPEDRITETIALPTGETSPLSLADLVGTHICYHDAQLNYIQALAGDTEMHWES